MSSRVVIRTVAARRPRTRRFPGGPDVGPAPRIWRIRRGKDFVAHAGRKSFSKFNSFSGNVLISYIGAHWSRALPQMPFNQHGMLAEIASAAWSAIFVGSDGSFEGAGWPASEVPISAPSPEPPARHEHDLYVYRFLPPRSGASAPRDALRFDPPGRLGGNDVLLGGSSIYGQSKKLQLYPAQERHPGAVRGEERHPEHPTGSGKSLVAAALHFKALAQGKRSVYTCPIKALVNEKWMALCREFGPDNVGLSTGDASVNRDAPILCCTAEILANIALREGADADVQEVIMDEFHYYADRERGVAWQVPLLTLPQARFLLMSATLGDTAFFEEELTRLNGRPTVTVASKDRPVPLEYAYSETAAGHDAGEPGRRRARRRCMSCISRSSKRRRARRISPASMSAPARKRTPIGNALEGFKFTSPYGPEIRKWLRHGIGLHHAGLLPKYRVLVEQLAQKGLLKVICGTDTLGVGINVPIRTVLFTQLCKFDGAEDRHSERARFSPDRRPRRAQGIRRPRLGGGAGARSTSIENLKLEEKAARDGKKVVKRKPPEKNFVNWDKNTFVRLIAAPAERLTSRFQVSHGMLLNVLSRKGDGCRAMQQLIRALPRDAQGQEGAPQARLAAVPLAGGPARSSSSSRKHRGGRLPARERGVAGRFFDGPDALALPAGDAPADRPASARLRAGAAHAGGVHPRRPGHHPAQAARQGERPEDGRDEDGRASNTTSGWRSWRSSNTPSRTASSSTPPSTPSPTSIPGSARKTSGPNPSRARCSRTSARSPITSATTNCSAPRACCCGI